MKKRYIILFAALSAVTTVSAQCAHEPTVTPSNLILCPNETDTLWTQPYDSYQWYRGSTPIPGATNQYLVVDQANDAGYNFSVEATLNSCTEMSPQVLVDGWAFLPPYTITDGDPGTIDGNGVQHNCPGDTVLLIMGQPYELNIQWYDNGNPIPGANDDTLVITQGSGDYTVSGSPAVCPDYSATQWIPVSIQFWPVITPVISVQGSQLECTPSNAASYQWYLNGNPISGANASTYQPLTSGNYSVSLTDANGCTFTSAPFTWAVGVAENAGDLVRQLYPNPAGDQLNLVVSPWHDPVTIVVRDVTGREVLRRQPGCQHVITLEVGHLSAGAYLVEFIDHSGLHLSSARFVKR